MKAVEAPQIPHDLGVERSVIGCILLMPHLIRRCDFPASAFYAESMRAIYLAASQLDEDGLGPDVNLIAEHYPDTRADMLTCLDGVCRSTNFDWYVERLRRLAYQREVAAIEARSHHEAVQSLEDPDAHEHHRARLVRMARDEYWPPDRALTPAASEARLRDFYRDLDRNSALTGFEPIDRVLGNLYPEMVVTILARPGVGKSALGLNLVWRWLQLPVEWGVMFCSLEMGDTLATDRLIRICEGWTRFETKIAMQDGRAPEKFRALTRDRYALYVRARSSIAMLETARQSWEREHGRKIRCVVIDYFQYLAGERGESPYEKGSRLTRELKEWAKTSGAIVVNLCQVKRGQEGGKGHECPTLESARDTGTIEENSDVVLGLWREKAGAEVVSVRSLKVREGVPGERSDIPFWGDNMRLG